MPPAITRLINQFETLLPREQIGIVAAAAVVIIFTLNFVLLTPEDKKKKLVQQQIDAQQKELLDVQTLKVQAAVQLKQEVVPKERVALDEIKAKIEQANQLMSAVDPEAPRIGPLVREMIAATPGLTLLSIKTIAATPVIEPRPGAAPAGTKALPNVYRHGVEVTIRGNYLAMLPYLAKLQAYPKPLFWSDASLDVEKYPDAVLKLTIYSLSRVPSSTLG